MSDEIKVSRPAVGQPASVGQVTEPKSSKMPWIVLAVIVVIVVVLGVLFRDKLFVSKSKTAVKSSGYQAVFLTNSQVYFGKVSSPDDNYVTLKDIYYLQVVTSPGLQSSGQTTTDTTNSQSQISLVKLGNELHGPVDEMKINRTQILFYEDLKEDSQVVQAIKQYQASQTGTQNAGTTNAATQTQQQTAPAANQQTVPTTQTQQQTAPAATTPTK